jgi:hypothetical protein
LSAVNREPERWEELAADAALVGLSETEQHELDGLLGEAGARSEVALFERAAGEVAAVAFAAQRSTEGAELLPESLRARLESALVRPATRPPAPSRALASRAEDAPGLAPVVPLRRPGSGFARVAPWLIAAAAIVVAVFGWRRPPHPPVTVVEAKTTPSAERAELLGLAGTGRFDFTPTEDPAARKGTGDVVWHSGLQRGFMRISGLAPNDPSKEQYQLWIFDEERGDTFPVDGGVFDVGADAQGDVLVPIQAKLAVSKAKLFAITVERPGGVVVSKRERIVLTAKGA